MNLAIFNNIIQDPKKYIQEINDYGFQDIFDGEKVFKNIQPRDANDDFALFLLFLFKEYEVAFNFIRKSPLNQEEPNFIHTDEMMGDLTCILYLNEVHPDNDGTTIYDTKNKPIFTMYSKFNSAFIFGSYLPHSRNILENFGHGENARLVQVAFLKKK